jgi:hypothetical protein
VLVLLAWLSATGALGNCNLFKPADPPTGTPVRPDYSTPDRTLATIAAGIADKDLTNGQEVYIRAFADSAKDGSPFNVRFDPADLDAHPTWVRTNVWNRDQERSFYKFLVGRNPWPYQVTWERYEPNGNDTDSLLHRKYSIDLIISGTKLRTFTGAADIYFTRSASADSLWVIRHWQDSRIPENSTAIITLGFVRLDRR